MASTEPIIRPQQTLGSFFGLETTSAEILENMPTKMNDFKKTGTLYKKRGGFLRNIPQQNWVPRTFALTHKGMLLYYEAPTITEACMGPGGGLSMPRQYLDLTKSDISWATPNDMTDGNTKYMLLITHGDRNLDNGQRLKLCANTDIERQGWVDAIGSFCRREEVERAVSPTRDGHSSDGDGASSPTRKPRGRSREGRDNVNGSGGGGKPKRSNSVGSLPALFHSHSHGTTNHSPRSPPTSSSSSSSKQVKKAISSSIHMKKTNKKSSSNTKNNFIEICLLMITFNLCCIILWLNRGEFKTHCLPIITLANGAVVAALLKVKDSYNEHDVFSDMNSGGDKRGGKSQRKTGQGINSAEDDNGDMEETEHLLSKITPGQTIKRVVPPKPTADSSMEGEVPVEQARDAVKVEMPSFSPGDHKLFPLRMVDYPIHGKKEPSDEPLYELIALDVFKTAARVDNIHTRIDLDKFDLPDTGHPDVPPLFLMNVQFPREAAKAFGDPDGPTCSVVFYFRITDATLKELQGPASGKRNALKLLAEWCKVAPDDLNFRGRFKAMGWIDHIEDYGIPAMCARFNGKPVLIKKTGTLIRGEKFIEMDINVHKFAYASRFGLFGMKDKFGSMVIRSGFTIEGKDNDELPEVLLGCANINGVNLDLAVDL